MKLLETHTLIDAGPFTETEAWQRIDSELREAITSVVWPPGSSDFTIRPERMGNGVKPINEGFTAKLSDFGWDLELPFPIGAEARIGRGGPGPLDAARDLEEYGLPPFVVEWETGNISSSHRAMNKMALGLTRGRFSGGILVLPSYALYRYLTDRIGNFRQLSHYLDLYRALDVERGYLGMMVIEFDALSNDVPLIGKGTDGRALV